MSHHSGHSNVIKKKQYNGEEQNQRKLILDENLR